METISKGGIYRVFRNATTAKRNPNPIPIPQPEPKDGPLTLPDSEEMES